MEKQFTADDVHAAVFADEVRHNVQPANPDGFQSVEDYLDEQASMSSAEEHQHDLVESRAMYLLGMQILKQARVIFGWRTNSKNVAWSQVPETAISPGVLMGAGWSGTAECYQPAWLEPREQPASLDFVTPGEAAVLTGTAESGWRNRAAAGKIPGAVKKGKQWLIPRSAI